MNPENIFVGFLTIFSSCLNLLVISALLKQWNKVNLRHLILVSLACSDLGASLTGFPFELANDNSTLCLIGGYLVSTFSLVSITHMVALCLERVISIKYPLRSSVIIENKQKCAIFLLSCWSYGILWGTFPWLGWGKYAVESVTRHRCSIDIFTKTTKNMSYNYALLVFCFLIPIISICACSWIIKREMRKMITFAEKATGKKSESVRATARSEKVFTVVVAIMLVAFLLAWTPYAYCVFYITANGKVSEHFLDVAAYLGKSSTIFNPIIYVFLYKEFRSALYRLFSLKRNKVSPSQNKDHSFWSRNNVSTTTNDNQNEITHQTSQA